MQDEMICSRCFGYMTWIAAFEHSRRGNETFARVDMAGY